MGGTVGLRPASDATPFHPSCCSELTDTSRHLPIFLRHHTLQQSSLCPTQALLLPPSAPRSRPTATQKPPCHPGLTPILLLCWPCHGTQDLHRCLESMPFPSTSSPRWSSQGFLPSAIAMFTVAADKEPLGPYPCHGSTPPGP